MILSSLTSPPSFFDASYLAVSKVDTLRPGITIPMVVDALRNDPSFNPDTVTRLWIATASRYDDSGEPTPHDTDQLMLEWKGGVQSLSPEVLAAICEVNPWGKIRGAHSELESAPWLLNMLQLNNLIHKVSQSLEGRGLALRYALWTRNDAHGPTSEPSDKKASYSSSSVKIGNDLTLPSSVASKLGFGAACADPTRPPSPPRIESYSAIVSSYTPRATERASSPSMSMTLYSDRLAYPIPSSPGHLILPARQDEVMSPSERRSLPSSSDVISRGGIFALLDGLRAELRAEMRAEMAEQRQSFEKLLAEQKEETDRKAEADNKILSDGIAGVTHGLHDLSLQTAGHADSLRSLQSSVGGIAAAMNEQSRVLAQQGQDQRRSLEGMIAQQGQDQKCSLEGMIAKQGQDLLGAIERLLRAQPLPLGPATAPSLRNDTMTSFSDHGSFVVEQEDQVQDVQGVLNPMQVASSLSPSPAHATPTSMLTGRAPMYERGLETHVSSGGRFNSRHTETGKRTVEGPAPAPPHRRADLKSTPILRSISGPTTTPRASLDDGNPESGAGADNPGGSPSTSD